MVEVLILAAVIAVGGYVLVGRRRTRERDAADLTVEPDQRLVSASHAEESGRAVADEAATRSSTAAAVGPGRPPLARGPLPEEAPPGLRRPVARPRTPVYVGPPTSPWPPLDVAVLALAGVLLCVDQVRLGGTDGVLLALGGSA